MLANPCIGAPRHRLLTGHPSQHSSGTRVPPRCSKRHRGQWVVSGELTRFSQAPQYRPASQPDRLLKRMETGRGGCCNPSPASVSDQVHQTSYPYEEAFKPDTGGSREIGKAARVALHRSRGHGGSADRLASGSGLPRPGILLAPVRSGAARACAPDRWGPRRAGTGPSGPGWPEHAQLALDSKRKVTGDGNAAASPVPRGSGRGGGLGFWARQYACEEVLSVRHFGLSSGRAAMALN